VALNVNVYQNLYFSLNDVRKKLDILGRLQVVLEILLLAESEMKFSVSSLQSLAAFSLSSIETQVSEVCTALRSEFSFSFSCHITDFFVMTRCSVMGGHQHLLGIYWLEGMLVPVPYGIVAATTKMI
jgi:hypothetical protein